jgi:hypothetical protein
MFFLFYMAGKSDINVDRRILNGRSMMTQFHSLFQLGAVIATPGALDALGKAQVEADLLLARHQVGDWGDVGEIDQRLNNQSLNKGTRLLSAYNLPTGVRLWVITEQDKSITTLLLPAEY